MNRRFATGIAIALVVGSGVLAFASRSRDEGTPADAPPLPRSMAAIGDSITQAVAVDGDALGAAPEHSWATGSDPDDIVSSHSERLIAAGALEGGVYNNSVPGARVADAPAQARSTVTQRVQYIVILIGANDVCAADAASMTTLEAFQASFEEVMNILTSGLPRSSVFVVSIPNVHRLWEVAQDQVMAQTVWDTAGICRSVLSGAISDDARRVALARNGAFNTVLEQVCSRYANCRYDDAAVFKFDFTEEDIGPLDYFHPSLEGQADLAEVSWRNGFWPTI